MKIAGRTIGTGSTFVIAELGINHNGDLRTALKLIDAAKEAGADAVKFQVGDPEKYVNAGMWDTPRETPWGTMPYIEYRKRMELSPTGLTATRDYAHARGIEWFASPLNPEAVPTLETMGAPCYKVASPKLTDAHLLDSVRATGKPVLLSTGMSTTTEIDQAVAAFDPWNVVVMHCTSAYPCPPELVNLSIIERMREVYPYVGFSDHTPGVPTSVAAVAMGACVIERHLTLSRAMWGSDHAASLEPNALRTLVGYIRTIEASMGDGIKRTYPQEDANRAKFRRTHAA